MCSISWHMAQWCWFTYLIIGSYLVYKSKYIRIALACLQPDQGLLEASSAPKQQHKWVTPACCNHWGFVAWSNVPMISFPLNRSSVGPAIMSAFVRATMMEASGDVVYMSPSIDWGVDCDLLDFKPMINFSLHRSSWGPAIMSAAVRATMEASGEAVYMSPSIGGGVDCDLLVSWAIMVLEQMVGLTKR